MKKIMLAAVLVLAFCGANCAQPITLCPSSHHYYYFQGRPTILITSAEHYGAVINRDFDYIRYLDKLKAYGMNYTRIYPGVLFEPMGKFLPGNTLGPRPASVILPWARSSQPGYLICGNKFDLDKWNPAYFNRLKDFIAQAGRRGIVVEICLFNSQYSDTWPRSPLYFKNNIQGIGRGDFKEAQTMKHPELVRRQDDYVRKIVREVNAYDNVILEICDEPAIFTSVPEAGPWVAHFLKVIQDAESKLPKKHLIAQEVQGPVGGPIDLSGNPALSVIVTQYLYSTGDGQMGGLKGLDVEYRHDKPIEENETDYYPLWYQGDKIGDSRVEAWEFIVGGGAGFNQLNGLYTADDPAGDTPDNARLLSALEHLKTFINSFDFVKMRPDKSFVISGVPAGAHCRVLSEPGKQYALYLHHSAGGTGTAYTVTPGWYRDRLDLSLPPGDYHADWIDPASGAVIRSENLHHRAGNWTVLTPAYNIDIALRVKQILL
ncbi:MAG TPA: hypothetical protein VFZ08_11805 [Terriglobia bacterium]|nr:hypothetical protein [Terriglobia bacterium]